MSLHTYYYQLWNKETKININCYDTWLRLMLILFLDDFTNVYLKWSSLKSTTNRLDKIVNTLSIPLLKLLISFFIIWNIQITIYRKTFYTSSMILCIMNQIKSVLISSKFKFIADLIKLLDPIFIINILLISLTDPIENTIDKPNTVTFYEIYFRYMEFHILMLAFPLIFNDRNIDEDVKNKLYTTSAVIGKYDSFRFSIILIFFHYLFIFINGLAFNLHYWKGLTSIFIAFKTISNYRQRKMSQVYFYFMLLIIWNICAYLIALANTGSSLIGNRLTENIILNGTFNNTNYTDDFNWKKFE